MKKAVILILGIVTFCSAAQAPGMELLGAGATFPYPYYSKLFDTYYNEKGVKINYQAIGSGGGIRQLIEKTVDFGGTDAIMEAKDIQEAGAPIMHIPTCLGAVVATYNIPGNPRLKLTGDLLADIYFGKIEKWNDPRITAVNADQKMPDMNIVVIHRSDGSGTTSIFSDYLCKVSAEWKEKVGAGKSLNWPAGLGAKGNPGVAGLVKQVPGSIGYVELIYAVGNQMPYADVRNKAGAFVTPSLASVSQAASVALPDDTCVSITDTDAKAGYPISGFTWIILYKEQNYGGRSKEKAEALLNLLWWVTHQGQDLAEPLQYAPLPKDAVMKAEVMLRSAAFGGALILKK